MILKVKKLKKHIEKTDVEVIQRYCALIIHLPEYKVVLITKI